MVTIRIGSTEQQGNILDEGWLLQQINRRRQEGDSVCVVVEIQEPMVKLKLATADCQRSGGSSRALTTQEQRVVELWRKHHLDAAEFRGGELIAFLKQLGRVL
jgi:hypothetical protein